MFSGMESWSDFPGGGSLSGQMTHRSGDDFVWDDDSINHVVNLYIKEIPRILLGCSWLREVVFEVNTKNNNGPSPGQGISTKGRF